MGNQLSAADNSGVDSAVGATNASLGAKAGTASVAAAAVPGSAVQIMEMTKDDHVKYMLSSKNPYVCLVYAPWCGHCNQYKPTFAAIAQALQQQGIDTYAIDGAAHEELLRSNRINVHGFPTLYASLGSKGSGLAKPSVVERDQDSIFNFFNAALPEANATALVANPNVVQMNLEPGSKEALLEASRAALNARHGQRLHIRHHLNEAVQNSHLTRT